MFFKKILKKERVKTLEEMRDILVKDLDVISKNLIKRNIINEGVQVQNVMGRIIELFRQEINKNK